MTTKNIRKGTAKRFTACLVFLCLWFMVPGAWAAYEVSGVTSTPFVAPMTNYSKCTEDITVSWTAPSMGTDILNSYFYQWNNSNLSLNDTDALYTGFSTAGFSTLDQSVTFVVKPKADLTALDTGGALYLHIVTFYLAGGGTQRVSADVVYGPFLIDNKAPTGGSIRIVDANGNDITSTSDTIVKVKPAPASPDTTIVHLNEASAILTSLPFPSSADASYPFADTTPGSKTIYAWFEDGVGNVSATPVTDTVTLLAPISINPNTATIATGATQVFRVEGTNATYNWTIINEKNEAGTAVTAGTIATITAGGSAANSVTVQGLAKGSFQLRAVPTSGTGTLTSGTITVVQSYTLGDVNDDTVIDSGDAILVLRFSVALTSLTDTQKSAGNVTKKADVNTIDSGDAIKILRYSVGLINNFD